MKKLLLLVVALAVLGLASTALAQEKTYVNGIDANYPPFAYVDPSGNPTGFDVESMDWIAKRMGFKVTHQPMAWEGIIAALLANKIDMVCSGMSITEERKEQVAFSEPYWVAKRVFIVKKGSTLTQEDLFKQEKIAIGTQMGTSESEALQKDKADNNYSYEVRFYDSAPMAVEDLLNGRINAALMEDLPANDAIAKGKDVVIIGQYGESNDFGVAMRKDDAELMKLVNDGYKQLKEDPYWQELQVKYGQAQ